MNWWIAYKQLVEKNTLGNTASATRGLAFWRDRLFSNIILYLLPVSFVALVPGVFMSIKDNLPLLAFYDTFTVVCFAIIALYPKLRLVVRKIWLISCLYFIAIILLIYLGSFGPGMLYLMAITVFTALIFPISLARWSIVANVVICLLFALLIHFRLIGTTVDQLYTIGSWIAVSSNLVVLSAVVVVSINMLFNGLEATITKEMHLQNQLREESQSLEKMLETMEIKNAELEQFAYIASHDLQEPLGTLVNVVDVFEKQYTEKLDGKALIYLSFLTQSSARMQALITGLLEYSRIGKEKELAFVDCHLIVKEALTDLREIIAENNATIEIHSLPSLHAYPSEFKQLVENLISNAIKFRKTDVNPTIHIQAREEDEQYVFSVRDNGIGIEEKFYKKIFIIFQRLHTKSTYGGTGVGLAQCKKIAELHGGKIWVESNPGQGSIFYFTVSKNLPSYGNKIKERAAH